MKAHTNGFKENVKLFGRELDSKITYELDGETVELGSEELNSITPHYEGAVLKSVMKQLDIDSNVEIPIGTILTYQFGVKVGNEYEYINFGNYIVYKIEKQEDLESWTITCYDKMLYSMIDYTKMNITYPISIRNYINAICNKLGLTFKNQNETFANYDKQINGELYLDSEDNSLGYKFRDVLDELAQVTASTICMNEQTDELEIRYISDTNDSVDEEYLKDINVNFGEKYGPVNSIVLSRSAGNDNVYLTDEQSVQANGLCEIKITDNQIMNFNDRSDYLPDILYRLDGLQYYLNNFSSTGITYYELCDRYTVNIGEEYYSCVMFNDEINVTQGLQENVYTDMPEQSETDYSKADKTDLRFRQTYFIVNKQNGIIESVVSETIDPSNPDSTVNKVSRLTQRVGDLESQISDIADLTISGESSYATMQLDNINTSEPIMVKVRPIGENISYLYPRSNLYPSSNLYLTNRKIRFNNTSTNENIDYEIPDDLLYYNSETYDEFYLDFNTRTCQVTKRCGYNADGSVYALASESINTYTYPLIELADGNYTISLLGYSSGYIFVRLMTKNIYTTQFYTRVETDSKIQQTAQSIDLSVNQKLSNYSTTTEMNSAITLKANEINSVVSTKVGNNEVISKINQSAEAVTINANKIGLSANDVINIIAGNTINLTSKEIAISSNNFSVDKNGNINATGGTIAGWNINSGRLQKTAGNYSIEISGDSQANVAKFLVWDNVNNRYNWYVTGEGKMYGRNCEINGTIHSNSGTIGGWNISGTRLYGDAQGERWAIRPYGLDNDDMQTSFPWGALINSSDERIKQDVKEIEDKFETFYDNLKPRTFYFKQGFYDDKKHIGFIAQDILESEKQINEDLSMVALRGKYYSLERDEIVALNTWQIQKLKKQVQEQQKTINILIQRIEKLERESDK